MATVEELRRGGEIGGRTVQINASGEVECVSYQPSPLAPGMVRLRTTLSAISPGTESTYLGRHASNVHVTKHWDAELRLFEPGAPSVSYPITFGYRAAGVVAESSSAEAPVGMRVWGNWRHTELVAMPASQAVSQRIPDGVSWDDAVDIGQMAPIGVNAAAFGSDEASGSAVVVLGAGPIGLITAQAARAAGAGSVTVVDRLAGRLRIAEGLGLAVHDASRDADVAGALKRRLGPEGVAVAWECTGSIAALAEAIRVVRRQGLVVAVGFYQGGASDLMLGEEFHHNGIRIASAQIGNPWGELTRRDLQLRTLELLRAGMLILGGLPRVTLPIERAADGFEALRRPDDVLQVAFAYGAN